MNLRYQNVFSLNYTEVWVKHAYNDKIFPQSFIKNLYQVASYYPMPCRYNDNDDRDSTRYSGSYILVRETLN